MISKERLENLLLIHLTPIWGKTPDEILDASNVHFFQGKESDIEMLIGLIKFRRIPFNEFKERQSQFNELKDLMHQHLKNGNHVYMYNQLIHKVENAFVEMVEGEAVRRSKPNSRFELN